MVGTESEDIIGQYRCEPVERKPHKKEQEEKIPGPQDSAVGGCEGAQKQALEGAAQTGEAGTDFPGTGSGRKGMRTELYGGKVG